MVGWFALAMENHLLHFEKTVAITEDGPRILTTEPNFRRPVNA